MGFASGLAALFSTLTPDEVTFNTDIDINIGGDEVDVSDLEESEVVVQPGGSPQEKVVIDERRVDLYPNELRGEQYAAYTDLVGEGKKETEAIDRLGEDRQTKALESVKDEKIDLTIQFYEDLLSPHYLSLLRSCLYLREIGDRRGYRDEFDIDQEKQELRQRYGYEAYYVAHLASSGYFDEDRFFRDLYHDIESSKADAEAVYQDDFEVIVGEGLLAVYVSEEDTSEEVRHDVRGVAAKMNRYFSPNDYVDVCGFGEACGKIIDEFIESIVEDIEDPDIERLDRGRERVVRIHQETLDDMLDID